jgi:hypothetical protein
VAKINGLHTNKTDELLRKNLLALQSGKVDDIQLSDWRAEKLDNIPPKTKGNCILFLFL